MISTGSVRLINPNKRLLFTVIFFTLPLDMIKCLRQGEIVIDRHDLALMDQMSIRSPRMHT